MNLDDAGNALLALGLTLPRIIGAFVMLPLLTSETVPALVRNSFLVSLAIVALPIAMTGASLQSMQVTEWLPLILKELFIGVAIGFCFGTVFWALGAAGNLIDTQVGMTLASVFDPIQGHQASLHGQFLSQLGAWLFMASGAFLVFLDLLLSSYAMWPVASFVPKLPMVGLEFFTGQFTYLMTALLVLASPVVVVLVLVDLSFGVINRFAPQLNVFSLTMPIKAWLASGILLLTLGVFFEFVLDRLSVNRALLEALNRVFSG